MKKLLICLFSICFCAFAAEFKAPYYEKKVESPPLPDILKSPSGKRIITSQDWENFARPEIVAMFKSQIYGEQPPLPESIRFETLTSEEIPDGLGLKEKVRMTMLANGKEWSMVFALLVPHKAKKPLSAFAGLHVEGGSAICALEGGYALLSFDASQIYPDDKGEEAFRNSAYALRESSGAKEENASAISAWAWAISFAIEYAEHDDRLDPAKVFAIGHSRFGKTALFAAACDTRFAGCIANNSGCMGAAPSRRPFGESLQIITKNFPHWFSPRIKKYSGNPESLPIDQHQLLACIAPRPLYIASASEDQWADPMGELISLIEAGRIYALYGDKRLPDKTAFSLESPFMGDCGYHLRKGPHAMLEYDWRQFVKFADKHLKSD